MKVETALQKYRELEKQLAQATQITTENEVIVKAAQFVFDVEKAHGNVPQNHISYGESLRMPLFRIVASKGAQSAHAKERLEALNAAIEYAQTGDKGARKRYTAAHNRADVLARKLTKGMESIGGRWYAN